MDNDLINRETLKKAIGTIKEMALDNANEPLFEYVELNPLLDIIDNALTVDQECYISGAQWDQFMEEHRKPQDTLITEIIEELESRKSYGVEYAQAMEDVINILKAKFGIDKETEND